MTFIIAAADLRKLMLYHFALYLKAEIIYNTGCCIFYADLIFYFISASILGEALGEVMLIYSNTSAKDEY